MTQHTAHLNEFNTSPVLRRGDHGRAALDNLPALHTWLPMGSLHEQMQHLVRAVNNPRPKAQAAIKVWADLVRGHALDFFADAGQGGSQWQMAIIDAWETWLLLRETQDPSTVESWPWSWGNAQFEARGSAEAEEISDPLSMTFGGSPDEPWNRIDMVDWRRALERLEDSQACTDSWALLQAWPRTDLPSLAIATGSMWAVGVVGRTLGVESLMIGGARGRDRLILTRWPARAQ